MGLEFLRCLNLSRELNSLDKVFGKPQGKGKHAGDFEKKNHWPALYRRVQELHTGDAPLDDELFGRAGKEFGMKKTAAKDLYYSLLPQYQRFCAAIGIDPLAPRNSGKF